VAQASKVALPAVGQGEVAGGEPVQERDCGFDVLTDADQLVVGGVSACGSAVQAPKQVPDGVVVQQVLLAGVAAAGDHGGDPAFQPGHLLITVGQRSDGDQDAAQVLDRLAGRQRAESGMGKPDPASMLCKIARAGPLSSQAATVPGRSAIASAW
jgi:hypothetical protein